MSSPVAQLVKNPPTMQETLVQFLGQEDTLEKGWLPITPVFLGFPLQYSWASLVAQMVCNVGDLDLIPGLGRSPGEGNVYPLQYSGLEIFHGLYHPRGHKELETTEQLSLHFQRS